MSTPDERKKRMRWLLFGILVIALGTLAWMHRHDLSKQALLETVNALHPAVFIAAFLVLPLLGAPISVFLVAAGIRFGLPLGSAITCGCIVFHHLVGYRIAHGSLRHRVHAWLERSGRKMPSIKMENRIWWTALFAAISGPPYAAKLYLLALTDVPFRIYLLVGAPIYMILSTPLIAAGGALGKINAVWISLIGISVACLVALTRYLKRRFSSAPVEETDQPDKLPRA